MENLKKIESSAEASINTECAWNSQLITSATKSEQIYLIRIRHPESFTNFQRDLIFLISVSVLYRDNSWKKDGCIKEHFRLYKNACMNLCE